jgi:peptidoglycan/LPS O-acetylase OafA/YrhL
MNIPYIHAPPQIGGPQIFPLNGPQFSLFFELIANAAWWSIRRIDQFYTSAFLYIASAYMVLSAGIGGDQSDNIALGLYHVGSSFFIGVFLFNISTNAIRSRYLVFLFYGLCLAMVILFTMPYELNFLSRMLWKLLLAPALVFSGSVVVLSDRPRQFCIFAGELSYPIYALHYPLFCWVNGLSQRLLGKQSAMIEVSIFIPATLIFSFIALRYYDMPVRSYLTNLLRRPNSREAAPA